MIAFGEECEMTNVQTYQGVVRQGRIHITPTTELPEGSHVYVIEC